MFCPSTKMLCAMSCQHFACRAVPRFSGPGHAINLGGPCRARAFLIAREIFAADLSGGIPMPMQLCGLQTEDAYLDAWSRMRMKCIKRKGCLLAHQVKSWLKTCTSFAFLFLCMNGCFLHICFSVHGKMTWDGSNWGQEHSFPTDPGLADIVGRTD